MAGVLAALKWNGPLRYGADADHVQVKRGADGLDRAKRVLHAARYYSFYTLDMADVLDYAALDGALGGRGGAIPITTNPGACGTNWGLGISQAAFPVRFRLVQLDAATVGRFVGKYWDALDHAGGVGSIYRRFEGGAGF